MEALIANLLEPGETIVVGNNGAQRPASPVCGELSQRSELALCRLIQRLPNKIQIVCFLGGVRGQALLHRQNPDEKRSILGAMFWF